MKDRTDTTAGLRFNPVHATMTYSLDGTWSHFYVCVCMCLCFQAMVEKLKSQLEAAQKAKELHAARKKEHEAAKLKQVGRSLFYSLLLSAVN